MTVPEPATRALGWLLVVGLAFYSADTAAAMFEDRLRVAPKPLPEAVMGQVEANVPAQAPPPGMVELLATTQPDAPATPVPASSGGGSSVAQTPNAPPASLKLRGTMAGAGGAGLAMIDVNGETKVVSVGDEIGGLILAEVSPFTARLAGSGGRSQLLEMDVATDVAAVVTPPVALSDVSAEPIVPSPSPSPAPGDPAADATPAPEAGAILSQRELRNILDNPGQFAGKGFRMKPVLREGDIVGMRVSMKDGSHPLARLGVQDGDIVRSLNGQELNGPEALSSIYRLLRNTSSLRFEVERNGVNQSIDVALSE